MLFDSKLLHKGTYQHVEMCFGNFLPWSSHKTFEDFVTSWGGSAIKSCGKSQGGFLRICVGFTFIVRDWPLQRRWPCWGHSQKRRCFSWPSEDLGRTTTFIPIFPGTTWSPVDRKPKDPIRYLEGIKI